jgi:hypothetical protein
MTRKLTTRTAIAALGALALGLSAMPGAAAANGKASTKVTIQAESDGFFGYVKSSKPSACANNRKVTLYKQLGSTQDPSTDQKIGFDTAQINGTQYMWSTGNTGSIKGSYYARAARTSRCQAASSPTVTN